MRTPLASIIAPGRWHGLRLPQDPIATALYTSREAAAYCAVCVVNRSATLVTMPIDRSASGIVHLPVSLCFEHLVFRLLDGSRDDLDSFFPGYLPMRMRWRRGRDPQASQSDMQIDLLDVHLTRAQEAPILAALEHGWAQKLGHWA